MILGRKKAKPVSPAKLALRPAAPPFFSSYRFGALTPKGQVVQGTLHESFVAEGTALSIRRRFRTDDGDHEEVSRVTVSPQWQPIGFESDISIKSAQRQPHLRATYSRRAVEIDYREDAEHRKTLNLPLQPANYDEYEIDQLLRHIDFGKVGAVQFWAFNGLYGYNLQYLLRPIGEERLDTPAGVVPCIKVQIESSNDEVQMHFRQTALYMREEPFCLLSKRGGRVSLTLEHFSRTAE